MASEDENQWPVYAGRLLENFRFVWFEKHEQLKAPTKEKPCGVGTA